MATVRAAYGKDANGKDAWVMYESGRKTEAFLTKREAKSRASSVAQKMAARSGSPTNLKIETKSGSTTEEIVEAGMTTGFGESLF